VGLSDLAQEQAPNISGGEAQRCALARALASGAKVLLLDEPSANVDKEGRIKLMEILQKLSVDPALTIIMATHDQAMEERLCQKRIRLLDGHLAEIEEMEIREGVLTEKDGRLCLWTAKEGEFSGFPVSEPAGQAETTPGTLTSLTAADGYIQLSLAGQNQIKILVRLREEKSQILAGKLTLNTKLLVTNN
jgi:energy-coupling factor transporter ATP-binding protein EcfA2